MTAESRIADRISPVHELLLQGFAHRLQSSRGISQQHRLVNGTWERVRQAVIGNVGPDAPVRSFAQPDLERSDHPTLAKGAHLIVHQLENSVGMTRPVGVRVGIVWSRTSTVRNKD